MKILTIFNLSPELRKNIIYSQGKINSVTSKIQTFVIHSLSLEKTQPRPSPKSVTDNALFKANIQFQLMFQWLTLYKNPYRSNEDIVSPLLY